MEQLDHVDEAIARFKADADEAKGVVHALCNGLETLAKFIEGRNPLAGILPTSEVVIAGEIDVEHEEFLTNAVLQIGEAYQHESSKCYFNATYGEQRKLAARVKAGKYRVVTILVKV